ncbi:hypothetical protein [Saccharopolyspora phatthalungensis]|uniref:Uncharacterized protein n=1 Tax=Saccharopolyspora phatthalungensis TaxID=664693 RepID=A0A840Q3Q6_9PSEU|nr:hypothetical protein [Saccharopolyspora phatthalungensis]MBB5154251.1 hypothetical protein [Saccharopolyspora phatthalungensis]
MRIAKWTPTKLIPGWRRARALRCAQVLDEVVNSQVGLLPQLPVELRRRCADQLAELVLLAQSYRHFAAGWISRQELELRGAVTLGRLADAEYVSSVQLGDGE